MDFRDPTDFSRIMGVLVRGEKDSRLTNNIKKLIEKYEYFEKSEREVSLEIYFRPQDKNDPAANLKASYSLRSKSNGNKNCIIGIDDTLFSADDARQLFVQFSSVGNLGYGFSLNYTEPGDGTYYAMGISTGFSSDEEREINSRWFMERLPMGTEETAKNRHLKGYFKDIFEIIGPSDCGKTTLLKLLTELYKPTSGEIIYNDINIANMGVKNYRKDIATVMQDDYLISGTIKDNICFFDPEQNEERIVECAKMAAIFDEIMQMPMQFNTLIGDMGSSLSGGQKQRVLLARALYKQPKILLLDEATSHLDADNENKINSAISSLNMTRVIVAHRVETITSTDRIVKLTNNQLVDVTRDYK